MPETSRTSMIASPGTSAGSGPQPGPQGSAGSRSRFRPRDPRRAKYYRASVALAIVFVCMAVAFPFWLDYVKRRSGSAPYEPPLATGHEQASNQISASRAPGSIPNPVASGNTTCQAYVMARCNAIALPPSACGEIAAAALAMPVTATLAECRKAMEPRLEEARRLYAATPLEERQVEAESEPHQKPEPSLPVPQTPAEAPKEGPAQTQVEEGQPGQDKPTMSPEERVANLARIYVLVEELQRAAQNYATLPAAQAARFEELRQRVEADGSEELRTLYNTLLQQHGRTAGFEVERPSLRAREAPMIEAKPGEEQAGSTTPELEKVRSMLEKAAKGASGPVETPQGAGTATPRSIDPSTVPAPSPISL